MVCTTKTNEQYLEAARVTIGREHAVCFHPVTGLVGGEYVLISDQTTEFYLWFSVDSTGSDPAIAGKTGIEVELPAAYTVKNAIDAIKLAVETAKKFYGYLTTDNTGIVLETVKIGAVLSAATVGDSGFTYELVKTGMSENLGDTSDGIEVTFEATVFDVLTNQSPITPKDQLYQGSTASMTMSLLEITKARLLAILGGGFGDTFTPASGTQLIGLGTSKNFQSSFNYAYRVVLHPLRMDGVAYVSAPLVEDVTFWKSVPLLESVNYSGTDLKAVSVTFNALTDDTRPEEISIYAVGDSTQFLA